MSPLNIIIGASLKALCIIPYKYLFFLGKVMSFLFYIIPNKHKKITEANLSLVFPNLETYDIKKLLKESLFQSSMNILESGIAWSKPGYVIDNNLIDVRNFKSIKNSIEKGNGVVLFTPHLGNIEILINFLGRNTKCIIPFTKPKNKYLDFAIRKYRNSLGVRMVDISTQGIREILKSLREGNVVAIASDQVPKKDHGIFSRFFDKEIYSMTLLPKLQQKTNCAAHLMFCERKENGEGFCIHFEDSIFLSDGIQEGVDKMNLEFEKCIMKFPSQYSWEYKKFKRTDQKSIYYK